MSESRMYIAMHFTFCRLCRRVKLIDLGAAADLRIGINYIPNEYLLDPRYAPPQQYIMSTSTPRAPPIPVAATLSPILWRLNNPDRFDMYSAGMALLQMSFPNLRSDNNLIAFNRRLETFNFDLIAWRKVGHETLHAMVSSTCQASWCMEALETSPLSWTLSAQGPPAQTVESAFSPAPLQDQLSMHAVSQEIPGRYCPVS